MDSDVVIQTRHLTKIYRDFWGRKKVRALNSLSLDVKKGEVFGLLGPNGSGKTTTIKLLLGLLFPTEGEVTILGQPAVNVTKNERIGYLPEESYLYRFLNAEETLDFYGRLFNMPAKVRRERAQQLIEQVGLKEARRRQLKEYSKGMTRRIGLAQALINDPDLILLDEPTSGLDPLGSKDMKDLIVNLKAQGKTVVMCSHLLADVQDVCDRIAILDKGASSRSSARSRNSQGRKRHADPLDPPAPGGDQRSQSGPRATWGRVQGCFPPEGDAGRLVSADRQGRAARPASAAGNVVATDSPPGPSQAP